MKDFIRIHRIIEKTTGEIFYIAMKDTLPDTENLTIKSNGKAQEIRNSMKELTKKLSKALSKLQNPEMIYPCKEFLEKYSEIEKCYPNLDCKEANAIIDSFIKLMETFGETGEKMSLSEKIRTKMKFSREYIRMVRNLL